MPLKSEVEKNIYMDIYIIYIIYMWPWHQGHYSLLGEAFPDHPTEKFKQPHCFDTVYLVHTFFFLWEKSATLCILSIYLFWLLPPPSQQNRSSSRTGTVVCPVHHFATAVQSGWWLRYCTYKIVDIILSHE